MLFPPLSHSFQPQLPPLCHTVSLPLSLPPSPCSALQARTRLPGVVPAALRHITATETHLSSIFKCQIYQENSYGLVFWRKCMPFKGKMYHYLFCERIFQFSHFA